MTMTADAAQRAARLLLDNRQELSSLALGRGLLANGGQRIEDDRDRVTYLVRDHSRHLAQGGEPLMLE